MRKHKFKSGMSLVELVIVIGLLGVLFAAVYMFFVKGTEQFHFIRQQNTLSTTGKLVLEQISNEVIWAGYMPLGGWMQENWKPIEVATVNTLQFYADFNEDGDGVLGATDHRNIFRNSSNEIRITDDNLMDRMLGIDVVALEFDYMNPSGSLLPKPLNESDREMVRHIQIKITLQSSYMGDVYETIMQTVVTPRNLGVIHDFNPIFLLKNYASMDVIVNIAGSSGNPTPTGDETALLEHLAGWGISSTQMTDDELVAFDFKDSGIDLVILRFIPGSGSHLSNALILRNIAVPMIILDPDDAANVFLMGADPINVTGGICDMRKTIQNHPIHDNIAGIDFSIYKNGSTGNHIGRLDSLYADSKLVTGFMPDEVSGVSVMHEDSINIRRIFYCAPDFSVYSSDGMMFLYNVIGWTVPDGGGTPQLGDLVITEGFEGSAPKQSEVTLWADNLEGASSGGTTDSVAIYSDFSSTRASINWSFNSTGSGAINRLADNTLEMHRTSSGGTDLNTATATIDLSNYSVYSDELYLTVEVWKGSNELVGMDDGVFLARSGGAPTEVVLAEENFEGGHGNNTTFYENRNGRYRVHAPGWNNNTEFVTLDNKDSDTGNKGSARFLIKVDTSMLTDGTPITVTYRMADHGDMTDKHGSYLVVRDYMGWSTISHTKNALTDYVWLLPEDKTDGIWEDYTYTFTPPGSMPDSLYIVFHNFSKQNAISATDNQGISYDDIRVLTYTFPTGILSRVGTPSWATGWQKITIDLDNMAIANGLTFKNPLTIALSQSGNNSWPMGGMRWRNLEIGALTYDVQGEPAGWEHWFFKYKYDTQIDDWNYGKIGANHVWDLHAHFPDIHSEKAECRLATPEIYVPDEAVDPKFLFDHKVELLTRWGGFYMNSGKVYLSVDNGQTWNRIDDLSGYNTAQYPAQYPCFSKTIDWTTQEVSLDGYQGKYVRVMFESVQHWDTVKGSGWTLDNFRLLATMTGTPITSIGFKPTNSGSWNFDEVNIWLGGTSESRIGGSGEFDKSTLFSAGTYKVTSPYSGGWATVTLDDPFFLAPGQNLVVKMEMKQASGAAGNSWTVATHANMTRSAVSNSSDPKDLIVGSIRPALRLGTGVGGVIFVDDASALISSVVPLAFGSNYSDFEAIYTMADMGLGGRLLWTHSGMGDDWEYGIPLFVASDIDPALGAFNKNSIAGNDLTDDGYYAPMQSSMLCSQAYPVSALDDYDSVSVAFDKCLRIATDDYAFVSIAFSDETQVPTDISAWSVLKQYTFSDEDWIEEVIQLTDHFNQARTQGKLYFFIRFIMDSGSSFEQGGWNIDNVGFYGRKAGV